MLEKKKNKAAFLLVVILVLSFAISPLHIFAQNQALQETTLINQVKRLSGSNRFDTAIEISKAAFEVSNYAILVNGQTFADPLIAGPLSGLLDCPIFLTRTDAMPSDLVQELKRLKVKTIILIGGETAISTTIESQLCDYEVHRLFGSSRYDTAVQVALYMESIEPGILHHCGLASGADFPDALAAAPYLIQNKSPLLLSDGHSLEPEAFELLTKAYHVVVFGGEGSISQNIYDSVKANERLYGPNRYETSQMIAAAMETDTFIICSGSNFADALTAASLAKRKRASIILSPKNAIPETLYELVLKKDRSIYYLIGGSQTLSTEIEHALLFPKNTRCMNPDQWPVYTSRPWHSNGEEAIQEYLSKYHTYSRDYFKRLYPYEPLKTYTNNETDARFHVLLEDHDSAKFDADGIPMVLSRGVYYYNPVTIAQYGIGAWTRNSFSPASDREAYHRALKAGEKLLELQELDGSFKYPIRKKMTNAGDMLEPGWVSALAQAQAMSLYARLFSYTQDPKWVQAGDRAYRFLLKEKEAGGVRTNLKDLDPSLDDYVFFEQYVTDIDNYNLNCMTFVLIALHEWSVLTERFPHAVPKNQADYWFAEADISLRYLLPYFDVGNFTSYDLRHITHGQIHMVNNYHRIVLENLKVLKTITGNPIYEDYFNQWTSFLPD